MPDQTIIDYSCMSNEELLAELKGLRDELEETMLREKQLLHDLEKVQVALLRKCMTLKAEHIQRNTL